MHTLDPDREGQILWQVRVGKGGTLGGSQWGSAVDKERVYVALSDVRFRGGGVIQLDPHAGGGLFGIDLARQASRPPVATAKAFNGALHECMRQTLASVATSQPLRLLNDERRRADMCSLGESLTPSLQSADQ